MATNPNEVGGWVVDPTNPNRATYTDPSGEVHEAFREQEITPEQYKINPENPTSVTPRGGRRGFGERFADSYKEASQYGFPGWAARKWYDWTNYGIEDLKKQVPGKSDDWYEAKADALISQAQKTVRDEMAARQEADPSWRPDESFWENVGAIDRWGPYLAANILGSAGPESALTPAGGAAVRVAGSGVVEGLAEGLYQGLDILDDVRKEFAVEEMLAAGAFGAGLQGVFEAPGFVKQLFKGRGADTTPGGDPRTGGREAPMSKMRLGAEDEAAYTDVMNNGTFQEAKAFADDLYKRTGFGLQTSEIAAWIRSRDATGRQASGAVYRTPEGETSQGDLFEPVQKDLFGSASLTDGAEPITVTGQRPEPVPSSSLLQEAQDEVVEYVNTLTGSWKNAPDMEVHQSFRDLPEIEPDAIAVTTPEGKVLFNMESIQADAVARGVEPKEIITAATFHESLGHHGLSQRFGDELDQILENLYVSGPSFQRQTDDWMVRNPDAYADDINPHLRAAEEVLAEMSESGRIDPTLMDRFRNWLKEMGRRVGLSLDYTDNEIRTILGMAHQATISGKGRDVSGNGYRYARAYHGSGADFDKFDHSKMGTGEGFQAYGWGTYLTDTKRIAEGYRDTIGGEDLTWDGEVLPVWQIRDRMTKEVSDVYGPDADLVVGAMLDRYNTSKKVPSDPVQVAEDIMFETNTNMSPEDIRLAAEEIAPIVEDVARRLLPRKHGKLYEVEVPDDARWLLWDEPIKDQPDLVASLREEGYDVKTYEQWNKLSNDYYEVRNQYDSTNQRIKATMETIEAQEASGRVVNPSLEQQLDSLFVELQEISPRYNRLKNEYTGNLHDDMTGEDLYQVLTKQHGGDRQASEALHQLGIAGNKYLDGFSRGKETGSYNYVVFDDSTPRIVNKYMRRRSGSGSEGMAQGGSRRDFQRGETESNLGLGPIRSTRRNLEEVLAEQTPEFDKQSWDEWIDTAGQVRSKVKTAKSLKVGSSPAEVIAAREAIIRSGNRIADLSQKAASGRLTPREEYQLFAEMARNADMQDALAGVRSNAARIVNSFRIGVESDKALTDSIRNMMRQADNTVLTDPDNRQRFFEELARSANDGQKVNKLVRAAFRTKAEDYIFRTYYNMLLSAPGTHIANVFGTGANFAYDLLEKTGAAAFGQGRRLGNQERLMGREVLYRVAGLLQAFRTGKTWTNARESLNTGFTGNEINNKLGSVNVYTGDNPVVGAVSGFVEAPTRALAGADEWWRGVIQLSDIYGMAARNAGNKGLKGKEFWEETRRLIDDPTKEMIEHANDYSKVIQFLDKPSVLAKALIDAQTPKADSTVPGRILRGTAKVFFPFVRTPDSLIRTTIRRSGILTPFERENISQWKKGGAERDQVIARMYMGSALAFFVATQAVQSAITGSGPSDYKKNQEWSATHQRNSIQIGDKYYSYEGLEPVSTNLSIVASLVEKYKAGEISDESYAEAAANIVQTIAAELNRNAYTDSFQDVIAIASGDEAALTNFIAGTASSVTTPAIVRSYAQGTDTKVRDTTGDGSPGERIEGRIKSGIPGLTEELPQRRDIFGRGMERNRIGPDTAVRQQYKEVETDPAVQEMARLSDISGSKVVVGAPGKNVTVAGVQRRLNAEEFQRYQWLSGFWITETIRGLLGTEEWEALSDSEKIKEIEIIKKDMRSAAREVLFSPPDEE